MYNDNANTYGEMVDDNTSGERDMYDDTNAMKAIYKDTNKGDATKDGVKDDDESQRVDEKEDGAIYEDTNKGEATKDVTNEGDVIYEAVRE